MAAEQLSNGSSGSNEPSGDLSRLYTHLLGLYQAATFLVLAYLLYAIWPQLITASGSEEVREGTLHLFFWPRDLSLSPEARLLLMVMVCGGIGSTLHGIRSFAVNVGRKQARRSYAWWYLMRVPVGAGLAIPIYFLIRAGGYLSQPADSGDLNRYAIGAISTLVGLFSEETVEKLLLIFRTALGIKEKDAEGREKKSGAEEG